MLSEYSISNFHCVTPYKVKKNCALTISKGKIKSIGAEASKNFSSQETYYLYPGLVNIHDHFRGNYLPRIGPPEGTFYLNWLPWDNDLKASDAYKERSNINIDENYLLSAYKNLFSGVITANDHFPHKINDEFLPKMPIRVIKEYTIEHECSSYDLKWGDGIEVEHARAVERNYPFITHLEEGFDEESQRGVEILEELNCLDDHDVLIHCIGFSDEDIRKVKEAGAHISWCPASNMLMFNVTCKIKKILESGINVSIGTDSTHTGSVNLLEEMRYARETYRRLYNEDLPAEKILEMVTVNPAKAFRMYERIGSIEEGKNADLLLLEPVDKNPYEALVKAEPGNISLLLMEGKPLLGDLRYEELFIQTGTDYNRISLMGKEKCVIGDPESLLLTVQKKVGYAKPLDFMPIDVNNV